jgi:hypothetical protein
MMRCTHSQFGASGAEHYLPELASEHRVPIREQDLWQTSIHKHLCYLARRVRMLSWNKVSVLGTFC